MPVPGPLVTTHWLAAALNDPRLRVLDATVFLHLNPNGAGYIPESGEARWTAAHIPGAQFIDLIAAFSDPASAVRFTMPSAARFGELAGALGVGHNSTIVIYSSGSPMWATRLWWMCRSVGWDNCAVLDGGLAKWQREGRAVTTAVAHFPAVPVTVAPRPALWADRHEVLAAMDNTAVCTINALSPSVYSGEQNTYGRAGHIPGSHNVFYHHLLNAEDEIWCRPEQLRPLFEAVGAYARPRVICYCGGGISATMDALALVLTGHSNIAVYDGSMMEWVADPQLPLSLGADA